MRLWRLFEFVESQKPVSGQVELTGAAVREPTGMAWHYKKYDSTPAYAQAQSEARAAKRGLWQEKNPIEPEAFRKAKREGKGK